MQVCLGQRSEVSAHAASEGTLVGMSQSVSLSPREAIAFVKGLRQIRQLRTDPLPQDALDDILEVARWTGSARNIQPWDVILIRERATLDALAHVEGGRAPHLANAAAGLALVMAGDPEHVDWDTYDEGRMAERIMLAAAAHSIGSAIGWFKDASAEEAKRLLGVPAPRLLRTTVSLGYVDEAAYSARNRPAQPRKPLQEVLHQERW
jgi:nitroreductase